MKHKYMVPAVVVALIVMLGVLNACDSLFGSSSSSGGGGGGGDLTIQGRLSGVSASSTLGALDADPDWVIVAVYWGPDFEHPDIMS